MFVGILTFMSMINFILSWVEHETFYNLKALICTVCLGILANNKCFKFLNIYNIIFETTPAGEELIEHTG